MNNKIQNLVNCFISGDFSKFTGCDPYTVWGDNYDKITFNDEVICYKINGNIFIVNTVASCSVLSLFLDCFEGITTKVVNNVIFINGIEWDGKKTNLELFK